MACIFIGRLVCTCNTYFALQTVWGSGMSLPAALLIFAIFRLAGPLLRTPFAVAENVFIRTVAGAAGTIFLASAFTGTVPALDLLLQPGEGAPVNLNYGRLILRSPGTCLVGSVFSTLLRRYIILREKLHESDPAPQSEEAPNAVGSALMNLQEDVRGSHIRILLAVLAVSPPFVRFTFPL